MRSCLRHLPRSALRVRCGPNLTRNYATSSTSDPSSSKTSTAIPKPRLDYRSISENVVYKSHNAFNRKASLPVGAIQTIDTLYKEQRVLEPILNGARHRQNVLSDDIRSTKDPQAKATLLSEAKSLKAEIAQMENYLKDFEERLLNLAFAVPNDTHPDTPLGPESAAVTLSTHGPEPLPPSSSRDHVSIGRTLGLLDLEAAAIVTGSSWYYLLNEGALLEMALVNYALSIAIRHGFTPVTTPDVVRADVAHRCGFQPRDPTIDPPVSQMYHISPSYPELVLAGTAEIPLAGLFANRMYNEGELPAKVVGLGRAFRAEAGARGADTRGLYRVHQFTKLELFAVSESGQSEELMEEMKKLQIELFEDLGLSFRVLDMPTEELGAAAYRKYDMEAWMPGRGGWGEISSTSNCTDYQARRLHIRYRPSSLPSASDSISSTPAPKSAFAHTLNGTATAVPRLIVALLENGARFDEDGKVVGVDLPKVLQPFWVGGDGRGIIRWV